MTMRAIRNLFFLLTALLATSALAAYYDHTTYPFSWIDSSSHVRVVWTGASGGPSPACSGSYSTVDDDISEELPLGFTFNFGGTGYTSVRVMSNGRLQFNNTYCYYGTQNLNPRTYTLPYANGNLSRTLRIYGADMDPTQGGSNAYVSYTQLGTAPNRMFVVTWKDIQDYASSSSRFNLQVILMENGDFIYQFGTIINSTGGKAQSGWQLTTSDYDTLSFGGIGDLQNSAVRFFRIRPLADWTMEGDFTDHSGNGYNGTGINGVRITYAGDPAYTSGGQNTCQYAQLDTAPGGERRYIQIGSMSTSEFNSSFSVTAWLRSTNVNAGGQRILVQDDNGNGWALSLGDGGSGKIRLFNRNQTFSGGSGGGSVSGVIFDSPAVVTNNNWYFLAATVDMYLRRATLSIHDSGGGLLASTSAAFSSAIWCPAAACTGAVALGGETLASPEGQSANFHFKGNLDEVRVYQGVLPNNYILDALQRTRACSATSAEPGGFNAVDPGADAIAGQITTKTAGSAFNLDLVVLNTTHTAPADSFNGNVLVDLIANTAAGVALDGNNCPTSGSTLSVGTLAMSGSRGTQAFPPIADAWRDVRVRMRYPASGTATVTACSADNFSVKPASLAAVASHADWQTAGTAATLANTGASSGAVHKAGRPFTLRVTGYNAAGAVTGNYDGSPTASLACVLPASGCTLGSLATGTFSTSGGTVTSNTAGYSEVGAISATLTDTGYASVDSDDTAASCAGYYACASAINIGRFVPDHFDTATNTPQFHTACGGFTYLGQPFDYTTAPVLTVTAKNAAGATTVNYTGSLFKLAAGGVTGQAYTAAAGIPEAVSGSLPAPTVTGLGAGVGSVAFSVGDAAASGGLRFARGNSPPAPFDAELTLGFSLADAEGVTPISNPLAFGAATAGAGIAFDAGKALRFGRLRLTNTTGSELRALPVPLTAQYWNGQGYVANTADNCTVIPPLAAVAQTSPLSPGLTFYAQTADNRLTAGETSASLTSPLVAGSAGLVLGAPGTGNHGYLDLVADTPAWLKFNWDGVDQSADGNWLDDNPRARAAFGKRRGADSVIIRREIY